MILALLKALRTSFKRYYSGRSKRLYTVTISITGCLYIPDGISVEEVAKNAYFFTEEAPNSICYRQVRSCFQERLRQEKIDRNLEFLLRNLRLLISDFQLQTETFEGMQNLKGINEIKAFIGGGFGYLIMMFIIIYGGFVMRSVIEEKTSRIIEVIISSVKPFQLMMGKIIGTSLAGITQFAIWIF